jgi:opine dehydrogenase
LNRIAIIGAGNGGCAMAADLTMRGFSVNLCEIYTPHRIEDLSERGGIEISGAAGTGFAVPELLTTDVGEAIAGVDLILWTVPATGHSFHVNKCARYLRDGHILILTPGAVGGSLAVTHALNKMGVKGIRVGETCTLPYGCRLTSPFHVEVYDVAKDVLFAMFPDSETDSIFELLQTFFPNLIRGENVLDTSLNYMNMLLHPVGMILNTGWIEHRNGDFAYYYDGISPSIARLLEDIDQERLHILGALDLDRRSFVEWFFRRGKTQSKESVYMAIHTSIPNRNFRAPDSLQHRFILEDVPFGLVPFSYIGDLAGVPTPVTDALILLASRMCKKDFLKEGISLERMGIAQLSVTELQNWVRYQRRS